MRKLFWLVIVCLLFFMDPAFAVFSANRTETADNGMNSRSGGESNAGNSAALATRGKHQDDRMTYYFTAPSTGDYVVSFDYKVKGSRRERTGDENVSLTLDNDQHTRRQTLETTSSTDGSSRTWRSAAAPVSLQAGEQYSFSFDSAGSGRHGSGLHINNVSFANVSQTQVQSVPAPGAILLASVGAGLVGWLRSRKVL